MPRRRDGVRAACSRQQAAKVSRQWTQKQRRSPAQHGARHWRAVADGGVDGGTSQLTWTCWTCKEMALGRTVSHEKGSSGGHLCSFFSTAESDGTQGIPPRRGTGKPGKRPALPRAGRERAAALGAPNIRHQRRPTDIRGSDAKRSAAAVHGRPTRVSPGARSRIVCARGARRSSRPRPVRPSGAQLWPGAPSGGPPLAAARRRVPAIGPAASDHAFGYLQRPPRNRNHTAVPRGELSAQPDSPALRRAWYGGVWLVYGGAWASRTCSLSAARYRWLVAPLLVACA